MTDTTDITALRAESADLMILLHKEGLGGKVTLTAAKFFDDVFRLLEAERQRADELKSFYDQEQKLSGRFLRERDCARQVVDELQAEIAALKGDQVPVGVWCIQEVTDDDGSLSRTEFLSVTDGVKIPKDAPLFTAPQKPVVLPHIRDCCASHIKCAVAMQRISDAIEAAGGKVAK